MLERMNMTRTKRYEETTLLDKLRMFHGVAPYNTPAISVMRMATSGIASLVNSGRRRLRLRAKKFKSRR